MRTHHLVLAVLSSASVAACTDASAPRTTGPSLELVDPTLRLDPKQVNAHVYGSFAIAFEGGLVPIRSGPANFPGSPKAGPGSCVDGRWINSQGKPTAGSLDRPHPHCVTTASALSVVLEPISSRVRDPFLACAAGAVCDFVIFHAAKDGELGVEFQPGIKGQVGQTVGDGTIVAYAIDAATIGGTNVRVGTLTINLDQFDVPDENLFGICFLEEGKFLCLPKVVTATYEPLASGGSGEPSEVSGFLWWPPATAPYNY
jgi:hypothetical protein